MNIDILCLLKRLLADYEFWKIVLAITAPFIVAVIGYKTFKKQKEYENIKERYLIEGFDKLIADYEFAMSSYRYNCILAFALIKQIKENPQYSIKKDISYEFISLKNNILPTIAVHRVYSLIEIKELLKYHQLLYSFVQSKYIFFVFDLLLSFQNYIDDPSKFNVSNEEIYNTYYKKLVEIDIESRQYDRFIGIIKILSSKFEENIYSKKSMKKFKDRKDLKEIFVELKRPLIESHNAQMNQIEPQDTNTTNA